MNKIVLSIIAMISLIGFASPSLGCGAQAYNMGTYAQEPVFERMFIERYHDVMIEVEAAPMLNHHSYVMENNPAIIQLISGQHFINEECCEAKIVNNHFVKTKYVETPIMLNNFHHVNTCCN